DSQRLKLGDFGIVRQESTRRGVTARTLNRSMVPSDMLAADAPKWRGGGGGLPAGQPLAGPLKGDAPGGGRAGGVRRLGCSDDLKEIIYRCIGERRKRYESADDLIKALTSPPPRLHAGALKTLKGAHIAFTGILSVKRTDAIKAARRAGATIHGGP